jgi:hypothetical protein
MWKKIFFTYSPTPNPPCQGRKQEVGFLFSEANELIRFSFMSFGQKKHWDEIEKNTTQRIESKYQHNVIYRHHIHFSCPLMWALTSLWDREGRTGTIVAGKHRWVDTPWFLVNPYPMVLPAGPLSVGSLEITVCWRAGVDRYRWSQSVPLGPDASRGPVGWIRHRKRDGTTVPVGCPRRPVPWSQPVFFFGSAPWDSPVRVYQAWAMIESFSLTHPLIRWYTSAVFSPGTVPVSRSQLT